MQRFSWIALAAALVLGAAAAQAQVNNGSSRDKLVVTPAWLAEHLTDRDLVILQVGRRATYDAGHIPGARFVDYDGGALAAPMDHSGRSPDHVMLEMPDPKSLRDQLAALGLSDNSRVVVVAADNYWSPSTRVMLTLDYAGLSNVMWLDGGLKGWKDFGRALSTAVPEPKIGTLSPLKIRPVVVDHDFVQAHMKKPGFAIVDARDRSFYDGIPRPSGGPRKPGHIPGAVSAPYSSFATGDTANSGTTLKPAAEIEAVLRAAGVKPGDTIIAYCHIGQQATAVLFAARTLGHNVLLYDGSFTEWEKRDLPVENPAAKK